MKKLISVILLGAVLLISVACSDKSNDDVSKKETEQTQKDAQNDTLVPNVPAYEEEKPLNQNMDIYKCEFTLGGENYKLPCKWDDFLANGWELSGQYVTLDTMIGGYTSKEYGIKNGDSIVNVVFDNTSVNAKKLKDCDVSSITIKRGDIGSMNVSLLGGITFESTKDEIVNVFGEPSSVYDEAGYMVIFYTLDKACEVTITKDSNDENGDKITLSNYKEPEEAEVSKKAPAYLSDYVRPESPGDDIFSGNVVVDGDLYRMPAPVSEFLNNGWEFKEKCDFVEGLESESFDLVKNGKEISVLVKNYDELATTLENCAIYRVTGDVVLPGNLKPGMTQQKFEDTWEEEHGYLGDCIYMGEYASYIEYSSDKNMTIRASVDTQTNLISHISFENSVWDY